eukprot:4686857-Amphidinium_carterae.1
MAKSTVPRHFGIILSNFFESRGLEGWTWGNGRTEEEGKHAKKPQPHDTIVIKLPEGPRWAVSKSERCCRTHHLCTIPTEVVTKFKWRPEYTRP